MNLYILLIYVATVGAFVFLLKANLSPSQVERQSNLLWYLLFFLVGFISYVIFASTDSYLPVVQIHFLTFGMVLPLLLSFVILLKRKRIVVKSETDLNSRIVGLLGIGASLVFFWLTLNNPKVAFNFDYISFLVLIALFAGLSFIWLFSTTSFCSDGIIYRGLFWAWSDFDSYSWASNARKTANELKLTSDKLWFTRKIKLQIPDNIKPQVENILLEKIGKK